MKAQVLETRINALEQMLVEAKQDSDNMSKELSLAKVALEKINLPKITKETVNEIRSTIEDAVNNFDFNYPENYTYHLEMDYDNRIQLSSIELDITDDLAESISYNVEYLFNIIED